MVFCNALFDGVVGVEVKDAVAGSCMKKTTTRAAIRPPKFARSAASVSARVSQKSSFWRRIVGRSFTGKKRRRHRDGTGSDSDVKQRKGSNHIDMLRKKGWPTTVVSAIEKTDGKGSAVCQQEAAGPWVVAGPGAFAGVAFTGAFAGLEITGAKVVGALAGPETGEVAGVGAVVGDFVGDLFQREGEGCSSRCEKLSDSCGFTEKGQMMSGDRC
ncbi:hypothetical protein BHM03_00057606 [Ensete ventricosum]|nr:hypothetical protein BHM03_00057606 [Ensete ventricosum]